MIEKHLNVSFYVSGILDEQGKFASYDPEVHIPEEISKFVDGLTPDPRFAYMHTIAMSDGDSYGSNMNGDIFTWEELLAMQAAHEAAKNPGDMKGTCLPRYKTFEQAKMFKHHANSAYDDAFGDVPLAVINLPMRRIELIIRIARSDVPEMNLKGAPDVCDRLDGGGVVPVSMGCRIGHEKCTYCGQTNEFISQRCGHMANQMGEIMPNGVKVAALNFEPRFFDISKVTIPADPIAMSLAKVAAFQPKSRPNASTDCATKTCDWRQKWSEIVKEIPADAAEKVAPGVEPTGEPPGAMLDEVCKAAALAEMDEVVSTATAMGIVFSPIELAKLASCYTDDVEAVPLNTINVLYPNYAVLDVLKTKFASRSGYQIALHHGDWHPTKIAMTEISDLYAFYRTLVAAVPVGDMSKVASANHAMRALIGNSPDALSVCAYLAHAGF